MMRIVEWCIKTSVGATIIGLIVGLLLGLGHKWLAPPAASAVTCIVFESLEARMGFPEGWTEIG